jgi:integrase
MLRPTAIGSLHPAAFADHECKANLKKGFLVLDISGTLLRVRKPPACPATPGGRAQPHWASLALVLRGATIRRRGFLRTVVSTGRAKSMTKSHLKLVAPATANRTVTPKRVPNADLRRREYLTEAEVERLLTAANGNRWGHRDATMILVGYRHGLRVSELVDLRWDQVDFGTATLHVRRVKQGTPEYPSDPRGRTTGLAAASTRAGAEVALCVHLGTRNAV